MVRKKGERESGEAMLGNFLKMKREKWKADRGDWLVENLLLPKNANDVEKEKIVCCWGGNTFKK